eukprot:4375161-Amphidinium_carterae.1
MKIALRQTPRQEVLQKLVSVLFSAFRGRWGRSSGNWPEDSGLNDGDAEQDDRSSATGVESVSPGVGGELGQDQE